MRLFENTPWDIPPRCERCGTLESECKCPPLPPPPPERIPPQKQTAKLSHEKRAKGKMVTVIRGLSADGNDLPALLTRLKSACGAGGTVREFGLEIQGDHRTRLRDELEKIGYRVKG